VRAMKKCQWAEQNVFCSDGAVLIDNNVSERERKRVVLNRKAFLFVGDPGGGRTPAILAGLTAPAAGTALTRNTILRSCC